MTKNNNIKIVSLKRKTPQFEKFRISEWELMDEKYYGKKIKWVKPRIILKALKGKKIVGAIKGSVSAGVAYVSTIIVKQDERSQGIGKDLMQEFERQAQKLKAHKIYLVTGKPWGLVSFYKSLGYKTIAQLPNHFGHVDFVEMDKML